MFVQNSNQKKYLINEEWFNKWISFLYGENEKAPEKIDNNELANQTQISIDKNNSNGLTENIDYYALPYQTWQ